MTNLYGAIVHGNGGIYVLFGDKRKHVPTCQMCGMDMCSSSNWAFDDPCAQTDYIDDGVFACEGTLPLSNFLVRL